jgi:uncharacterized membrane protein YkvA (DUF1232 family)
MTIKLLNTLKRRTTQFKTEACSIYLAYKDPRVPWYTKILILFAIGYAFSPIDKLLSFIPIIGYLDHLIFVPLVIVLVFKKMIPSEVLADSRKLAINRLKANRIERSTVVLLCLSVFSLVIVSAIWVMKDWNLVLAQWFRWFARMTLISGSNAR